MSQPLDRDVFLSIVALDSYNRGYGANLRGLEQSGAIGRATIRAFEAGEQNGWQSAGFYAIAYDVSAVSGFVPGGKVISYRGTNTNPVPELLADIFNGWTLGAGFPGGKRAQMAANF
jgi:hypothetical protein